MSCSSVIKQKGLKLTPQRRLILDILHKSSSHISAEDIIREVQKEMPGVNKTTIYRTLDLLEGIDCVYKSGVDGRYVYHHAEYGHHHHLMCSSCGKIIDCAEDIFLPVEILLNKKYGFQCDLKHMIIKGLCSDCIKKA